MLYRFDRDQSIYYNQTKYINTIINFAKPANLFLKEI
jgi:hypothetical protein